MTSPAQPGEAAHAPSAPAATRGADAARPAAGEGLRQRAARGALINATFQVGFAALGLLQRFVLAVFLTASQFGVWGLVLTTVLTLSFLKQVGINDKYVQQDESDQEAAFQKAFTLELLYSGLFTAAIALVLPVWAAIYGRPEVLLPSLVLCVCLLASAFYSPIWIAHRQMRFVKQRLLEGINPVVATAVMIPMAAGGLGYWSPVIGLVSGSVAAAAAALLTCPYRLAFRLDRRAVRDYVGFSWPLLVSSGSALLVTLGTMVVANHTVGLEGVGAITLASSLLVFALRVDTIIEQTMYPAVCAVKDRLDVLFEAFVKSNRLALMWGIPFGFGMLLFAPDLVDFVLGSRWGPAVGLLQALGVLIGLSQLGFNWSAFMRARGTTRPLAVSGIVSVCAFALAIVPLMIEAGLKGYAIGMAVAVAGQLVVRAVYMSRLFSGFDPLRHAARAILPSCPAIAVVLAARALEGGPRTIGQAALEFGLYVVVTVATTLLCERRLVAELIGYVRGDAQPMASATGREALAS